MKNKMTNVINGTAMLMKKVWRLFRPKKKEPKVRVVRDHTIEDKTKRLSIDELTNRKQDEQVIKELNAAKDGLALIGEKEGNMGIPAADIRGHSPTIQEWIANCETKEKDINNQISYKIAEVEQQLQAQETSLNEFTYEERIEYHISQQQLEKLKGKFFRRFIKWKSPLAYREAINNITIQLRDEKALAHDLIKRIYHQVPPKKRLTDYTLIYVFLLMAITMGELPLNVAGLTALGELSNLFVLVLSGFFALILGFASHSAGHAFFKKQKGEWMTAVGIGLAVCTLVSILRAQLHGSIIMSFMNVLIFFFSCYIAYDRAKNNDYWSIMRRIRRLERKKRRKENLLRRIMDEFRALAEKEVREQLDTLKQGIAVLKMALSTIQTYQQNITNRIAAIRDEGIAIYRNANSLSRKQLGHPPVQTWQQDARVVNTNAAQDGTAYNTNYRYTHSFAFILLFLSLFNCKGLGGGNSSDNSDVQGVILFDQTDPKATKGVELEEVADYLLEEVLEINETDLKSQGVSVQISSIGSTSIQRVEEVELASGGSFLTRTEKDRETLVDDFKTELHSEIVNFAKAGQGGKERTVLFENLCEHLNRLAASKAEKKAILIFSDMLQHTDAISFYTHRNRPENIMDNYGTLSAKMDMLCPLPSLDGITVTIVYLPDESNDRLFQFTKTFWLRYLSDYGATVNFAPNI